MIKMTPLAQFWNWFIHREPELFDFDATREAEREAIFREIASCTKLTRTSRLKLARTVSQKENL
jgi:hypothetical protein